MAEGVDYMDGGDQLVTNCRKKVDRLNELRRRVVQQQAILTKSNVSW